MFLFDVFCAWNYQTTLDRCLGSCECCHFIGVARLRGDPRITDGFIFEQELERLWMAGLHVVLVVLEHELDLPI